jgi:hypothetical protein
VTPPRGGAGDGSAAIVNGWVYLSTMRTRALRVTVGVYESAMWHVSIIQDVYERGVLVDSVMWWGPMYCGRDRVLALVQEATRRLMEMDELRVLAEARGARASLRGASASA